MPQETRGKSMNEFTRSDSRDAWMAEALRSRAEDSHPRIDCPHPERIWDAVRLQASLDERLKIIDHLAECPTCAEAWKIAAELLPAHEEVEQPQVAAFEPGSAVYGKLAARRHANPVSRRPRYRVH